MEEGFRLDASRGFHYGTALSSPRLLPHHFPP
jgi:hypothetical protein